MIAGLLAAARRRSSGPPGPVVTNGTFNTDIAGWTPSQAGAAQWVAPGRIRVDDLGSYSGVSQALSVAAGVTRQLSFECPSFAGLFFQVGVGFNFGDTTWASQNVFAAGSFGPISFTPTSSTPVLWMRSLGGSATDTATFDNIVVI